MIRSYEDARNDYWKHRFNYRTVKRPCYEECVYLKETPCCKRCVYYRVSSLHELLGDCGAKRKYGATYGTSPDGLCDFFLSEKGLDINGQKKYLYFPGVPEESQEDPHRKKAHKTP